MKKPKPLGDDDKINIKLRKTCHFGIFGFPERVNRVREQREYRNIIQFNGAQIRKHNE